jgi:hypothetical protein
MQRFKVFRKSSGCRRASPRPGSTGGRRRDGNQSQRSLRHRSAFSVSVSVSLSFLRIHHPGPCAACFCTLDYSRDEGHPLAGSLNASGRIEFIIFLIMDWSLASGCSPPRLSTTQFPSATDSQCSVRRGLPPHSQAHKAKRPALLLLETGAKRDALPSISAFRVRRHADTPTHLPLTPLQIPDITS